MPVRAKGRSAFAVRLAPLARAEISDHVGGRSDRLGGPVDRSVLLVRERRAVPAPARSSAEHEVLDRVAAGALASRTAREAGGNRGARGLRHDRSRRFRLRDRVGGGRRGLRLRGRFRLGGGDHVAAVEAVHAPQEEQGEEREGSDHQHADAESLAQTVAGRAALDEGLLHLGRGLELGLRLLDLGGLRMPGGILGVETLLLEAVQLALLLAGEEEADRGRVLAIGLHEVDVGPLALVMRRDRLDVGEAEALPDLHDRGAALSDARPVGELVEDERAVAAAQIFDLEAALVDREDGVVCADVRLVDHPVVVRCSAHAHARADLHRRGDHDRDRGFFAVDHLVLHAGGDAHGRLLGRGRRRGSDDGGCRRLDRSVLRHDLVGRTCGFRTGLPGSLDLGSSGRGRDDERLPLFHRRRRRRRDAHRDGGTGRRAPRLVGRDDRVQSKGLFLALLRHGLELELTETERHALEIGVAHALDPFRQRARGRVGGLEAQALERVLERALERGLGGAARDHALVVGLDGVLVELHVEIADGDLDAGRTIAQGERVVTQKLLAELDRLVEDGLDLERELLGLAQIGDVGARCAGLGEQRVDRVLVDPGLPDVLVAVVVAALVTRLVLEGLVVRVRRGGRCGAGRRARKRSVLDVVETETRLLVAGHCCLLLVF